MMYLNGNHISNYSQPIHFHYPINRRLGSRVASDSTISSSLIIDNRPCRVRVSLYESGRPSSIISPETPEPLSSTTFNSIDKNHNNNNINCYTAISRIINPPSLITSNYTNHHHPYHQPNHNQQQQSISHSTLSSTTINNHPHHPNYNQDNHQFTLDLVKMMERKISVDSVGFENPFRPGGELSREAETIVNLIKEGKPITPTTPTKEMTSGDSPSTVKILNGISNINNQSSSSPSSDNHHNHQLSPSTITNGDKLINSGSPSSLQGGGGGGGYDTIDGKQLSKTNATGGDSSKVYPETNDCNNKLNGSSKLMLINNGKTKGGNSPGKGERSSNNTEQIKDDKSTTNNKKNNNKKCICCVVQ